MSGLLSSLTNVSNAAVPFLFNALQSNEPAIQAAIVSKLTEIKTSNPAQYNMFLTNWRKLSAAIEQSAMTAPTNMLGGQDPAVLFGGATPVETEPVIPSVPTPAPELVIPSVPTPAPEPTPPIVEPIVPTGPSVPEATGPSFASETGPTGPSIVDRISSGISGLFQNESGPTGATGGKKHRKRKTAKQHRKRTHRVKHRKH